MTEESKRDGLLTSLQYLAAALETDCLEVLCLQAEALVKGQRQYGALDLDNYKKDAVQEAIEEARDLANYLNFKLVQIRRNAK